MGIAAERPASPGCKLPQSKNCQGPYFGIPVFFAATAYTSAEVTHMKEEEKKPRPWEAVDPKPPVVQSGHLESKAQK